MHELSVTQNLLEITLRHARQAKATRVVELNIVIGQLASIVDDSVQFYWNMIAEGTEAQGAKLNFQRIPTQLLCLDCGQQYAPNAEELACPDCCSTQIKIVNGREFYLDSISVE